MRVVVALGGNALLRRGEPPAWETQRARVPIAAEAIARVAQHHQVVVTHGNGPQVGLLALQAAASSEVAPYPLDVLGAESEGMIGYLIEQALRSRLPECEVATLLTQTEVSPDDPAFAHPTKPIGAVYPADAKPAAADRVFGRVPGGWRRLVPSPEPLRILELATIRRLVEAQTLLICAGGGGIPVVREECGSFRGVEAVVDKDLTAALLALELGADALLLLTDVPAVFEDWPEPALRPLRSIPANRLDPSHFEAGSMGPKLEAARRFVVVTGGFAGLGALEDAAAILAGSAGTRVLPAG